MYISVDVASEAGWAFVFQASRYFYGFTLHMSVADHIWYNFYEFLVKILCHWASCWGHLWDDWPTSSGYKFDGPGPTKETALTLDKAVSMSTWNDGPWSPHCKCGVHQLKWWQIGWAKSSIQAKTTKDLLGTSPCWWWNGGEGPQNVMFIEEHSEPCTYMRVLVSKLQEISLNQGTGGWAKHK